MRKRNHKKNRYRDLVDLQHDVSADGVVEPSWEILLPEICCLVTDVTGMSAYRGVQLEETLTTAVEMHKVDGIKPDMRLIYEDRTLEIRYVQIVRDGNMREKHWVFCNEVAV